MKRERIRGLIMRALAAGLAVFLGAGYLFVPAQEETVEVNNSGRKKQEITQEGISWPWTPSQPGIDRLELTISGLKAAAGMTLSVSVRDSAGAEVASARQAVDELGESDRMTVSGSFSAGAEYTLLLRAEGEGTLKIRGEEDENGDFYPLIWEVDSREIRNPVVLYFAAGLLLLALTPVFEREEASGEIAEGQKLRKKTRQGVSAAGGKKGKGTLERLLPWGTFLLILSVGLLVGLHKPPFEPGNSWQSWDEELHIAYMESAVPALSGSLAQWLQSMITFHPGYLPLVAGETAARCFTMDAEIIYRAAVLCATLAYAIMAALAVRHAPRYKVTFLVAATFPTVMYLMTSVTYDTMVIGSILLGLALVLEAIDREERLSMPRAMTILALLALGTVAKPAYSIALLSVMLIPAERLDGKGRAWMFRVMAVVLMVWCIAATMMPGAYDDVREGDSRYNGVNASEQIAFLLENPGERLMIPLRYLWEHQRELMVFGISGWAYLGTNTEWSYLYAALLLWVAPLCAWGESRADRRALLTAGRRIGLALIALGAEIILLYTQYIVSSPVGGELQGMQPRYFVPVWIAMALALMMPRALRDRVDHRVSDLMSAITFGMCCWVNISYALTWLTSTGYL